MQQATTHPHAAGARPTTQRLAWFGGLAWRAHVALDRGLGYALRSREGFQRG